MISDARLFKLWAEKVKELAGNKCEKCGKPNGLNSHHIYSRSKLSTRWDTDNGVCLCVAHHTLSSSFSAHKTPAEFIEWIKERRGEEWYMSLRRKANAVQKKTAQFVNETYIKLCQIKPSTNTDSDF